MQHASHLKLIYRRFRGWLAGTTRSDKHTSINAADRESPTTALLRGWPADGTCPAARPAVGGAAPPAPAPARRRRPPRRAAGPHRESAVSPRHGEQAGYSWKPINIGDFSYGKIGRDVFRNSCSYLGMLKENSKKKWNTVFC